MILKKQGFVARRRFLNFGIGTHQGDLLNENSTFSNIFCKQRIYFRAVISFWRLIAQITISVNFQVHCEVSIFSSNRYIVETKCKIFWQLVILKINALSEGKELLHIWWLSVLEFAFLVYFTRGARKISIENKYVPLLSRLSVPQGLQLSFLQTTVGLKSIYWVSLKGGTFGTIFFLKKPKISA